MSFALLQLACPLFITELFNYTDLVLSKEASVLENANEQSDVTCK